MTFAVNYAGLGSSSSQRGPYVASPTGSRHVRRSCSRRASSCPVAEYAVAEYRAGDDGEEGDHADATPCRSRSARDQGASRVGQPGSKAAASDIENQESRSDDSEGGRRSDASAQDGDEDPGENENRAGPDLRSRAAVTAPRVSASSRRRERASGSLGRARSGEIQYSSGRSGSEEWDERPR